MISLKHILTNCAGVSKTRFGYSVVISFILLVCSHWPTVVCAPNTETTAALADANGNHSAPSVTTNTSSPVPNTGSSTNNAENVTDSNSTSSVTSNTSPVPHTGSSSHNAENVTDSNNSTSSVPSNTTSSVEESGSSSSTVESLTNSTTANSGVASVSVTTAPLDEDLIIVLSFGGFFIVTMFTFVTVLCVRHACRPNYKRFPSTTPTANNIRLP